ncbi:hypothetical protein B0A55_05045 [Friedmanniomyces simplex]|uniref:SnoaL-like domain-containing protein n=1 Tax=Friedmanniomyces simplex TaxID=329884 RepID=A0A4U0XCM6_9PEZI|nr:hypothetical protein B0A55_05045 [Friedmanniomyces simplex]
MAFPIALAGLTTRDSIVDAVYRGTLAFDTGDATLLESAMTDDAVLETGGMALEGMGTIRAKLSDLISKLDTTHFVTNLRVDIQDGEAAAHVTANFLAQHYREGQGVQPDATRYLVGGVYLIDMVKDEKDGLWKSKYWKVKPTWSEGDRGVMSGH